MITKSLVKLIDESLIPAIALIVAKMVGLFLASQFLHLNFTVKNAALLFVLPKVQFASVQDYILAENYSNLTMFITAAAGTILVLVRAHFFHQSHIHPNLQAKLVSLNMESLIASSYHLYHQALIWITFLWLTTAFLVISTIVLHVTYPVISAIAFIISANFSWIFAMDVEKEVELSKNA